MKGLIIKDYYCLKKSIGMEAMICIITIFLAVMFCLSARYGNVHAVITDNSAQADGLTEQEFYHFFRYSIGITILIPLAFMGNIMDCFTEDKRAGFSKTLFSLPLTEWETAGARYVVLGIYTLVGILASLTAAVFVSMASKMVLFLELCSMVFVFAGILLITLSLGILLQYRFAFRKAGSSLAAAACLEACGVLVFARETLLRVYSLWKAGMKTEADRTALDAGISELGNSLQSFFSTKGLAVFGAALLVGAVCYLGSAVILKKKRSTGGQ